MPTIPSSIIDPIWDRFAVPLPAHEVVHLLGFHRAHISDRVVFDTLVQVRVFDCAYYRLVDATWSANTFRRRRDEWIDSASWTLCRRSRWLLKPGKRWADEVSYWTAPS